MLWGNHSSAFSIFKLQKKVLHLINRTQFRNHCKPLFILNKILNLHCIYILQCLLYIKKINDFTLPEHIHHHRTTYCHLIRSDLCHYTLKIILNIHICLQNCTILYQELKFLLRGCRYKIKHQYSST
ncbi:hypothetical protein C0J52_06992 [Blattella germanica]|nr:hypothetical protein C0J52_06992 [Blattella germanica]